MANHENWSSVWDSFDIVNAFKLGSKHRDARWHLCPHGRRWL